MTARERLIAAARGGEVDRTPTISWPGTGQGDASVVVDAGTAGDSVTLVEISNPFGRALDQGLDLNAELATDPEGGARRLDALVAETKAHIATALSQGADGVLYRLHGACAERSSPMQYGGHYLERDREILEEIADATLNLIFVVGDRDLYLDFVSDLPGHLFGWDDRTSGVTPEEGRQIRNGAVATFGGSPDVRLITDAPSVAQQLERTSLESAV